VGRLFAVEIVYRGIFQKNLAKNISRGIVLAAKHDGKTGISFGRYGDSPERNGIPAKNFAIVATDDETLQEGMAKYEPKETDISISVDDTLCKGVESWAWYGLQPINRLLKPNGTLIVTTMKGPEAVIEMCHRKDAPYRLALLTAIPSFSGLWVYKDDHTDVRILGAIAKVLPELLSLKSVEKAIKEEWHDDLKVKSAQKAFERVTTSVVSPQEGNPEKPYEFELPKWYELREGLAIPSIPKGKEIADPVSQQTGGFRPDRNPTFKKYSTRTMRPVVDFDTCVKCTLAGCSVLIPASTSRPTGITTPICRRAAAAACARPCARWRTASPWSTRQRSPTTPASGRCGRRRSQHTRRGCRRRSSTNLSGRTASGCGDSTKSRSTRW